MWVRDCWCIKVIVVVLLQPWWSKYVRKSSFILSLTGTGRVPNTQGHCSCCEFWSTWGKFRDQASWSFPSPKSASIGADLPANGQIQVPIKHCIVHVTLIYAQPLQRSGRRVCSHFLIPILQLTAQHLSCSDGQWLYHSFLSTLLIQDTDYLDREIWEWNNLLLCFSLCFISLPLTQLSYWKENIFEF